MEKKTDRRVRKTKNQLRTGLARLMKKKNIGLIAGIVLLVVLCVVYFVLHNHNANSSEADSTDTATTAFETDTDKLTELTVTTEGQSYTFTKSDDTWSYSGDASFPLDQSNFEELAGKLKSISSDMYPSMDWMHLPYRFLSKIRMMKPIR